MFLDKFFHFWFENLFSIIQWQVFVILLFAVVVLYFMIREKDSGSGTGAGVNSDQVNQLEITLKKVLEQTGPGTVSARTVTPGEEGEAASSEEMQALNTQLVEKEEKIKALTEEIEKAKEAGAGEGGEDDEETKELKNKLAQLEAQLAEYAIIEDDIADLSLYKEENTRLKEELEALKAGGAVAKEEPPAEVAPEPAAPAEPAAEEPPTEPSKEDSDLVAEFAEAVGEPTPEAEVATQVEASAVEEPAAEPVAEAPAEPEPAPQPQDASAAAVSAESSGAGPTGGDTDDFITDDILAEFSAAVDKEFGNALEEVAGEQAPAAQETEPANDSPSPAVATDPQSAVDEAMAKAAGEKPEEKPPESLDSQEDVDKLFAEATGGGAEESAMDIDTEKMLGEIDSLNAVAESSDGESGLEEELDIDKMAQEASSLTKDDNNA